MSDYLYNSISVLGEIEHEKYEELKAYFAGAPMWLIDSFQIRSLRWKRIIHLSEKTNRSNIFI